MADHPFSAPGRAKSSPVREPGSLESLYRLHVAWLRRALGHRLGGHPVDVEDIVHDAYIRVARYSEEDAGRHPKALLLRIALNLARDQIRRNARMPASDLDSARDIALDGDQEYVLALKRTIFSLPPDLRNVFLLSRFTAMTNVQIAEHLGVSVKTVEYRVHKALLHCSDRLAK